MTLYVIDLRLSDVTSAQRGNYNNIQHLHSKRDVPHSALNHSRTFACSCNTWQQRCEPGDGYSDVTIPVPFDPGYLGISECVEGPCSIAPNHRPSSQSQIPSAQARPHDLQDPVQNANAGLLVQNLIRIFRRAAAEC